MIKPIGFCAFLKMLELSDARRKTALSKKLGAGKGFQYWRPLQTVAPKALLSGADFAALEAEIKSICSGHQQTYNLNALRAFIKWVRGKSLEPISALPVLDTPFGNSGLVVRLRHDISFALDGVAHSMNLWATTKPILSKRTLSVGLFFLAAAYKAKGYTDRRYLILDTISDQLFNETDILPLAIHLLKDKVDTFKKDLDSLAPTSPKSPEAPKPDHPAITK